MKILFHNRHQRLAIVLPNLLIYISLPEHIELMLTKQVFPILMVMLISVGLGGADLASIAMKQPRIDQALSHVDTNSYKVAIQPSSSATQEDLQDVIRILIKGFGKEANTTGYDGKLQIGVTDRQGRVIYILEVSANDAITYGSDTDWLEEIPLKGQTFNDDTRNYDPYVNRYTPFPSGKGVLGSMVYPWLGYKTYGNNVWFDPSYLP